MGVHPKSKGVMKKKDKHTKTAFQPKELKSVNKPQNKIKKSEAKNFVRTKPKIKSDPKPIDLESLDKQLETLNSNTDNVTKKMRKKIRQLEYLKKKYTQIQNTENSLKADVVEKDSSDDGDNEIVVESNDNDDSAMEDNEEDPKTSTKTESMKGIQRFVVFVGNLPKLVTEEDLKTHFAKVGKIKSVRIPDDKEARKNGFAFLEVEDSLSFEKTLSMHHTMLGNKRINVLYTNPDGKNLDIKEIRKKNAKFDAMRKSGLLAGSTAEHKKRSFRRKKKRLAEAKASAAMKAN